MNTSFRTAFWAMCLGLVVPMVLYVGAELSGAPGRRNGKAISDRRGSLRDYLQKSDPKVAQQKRLSRSSRPKAPDEQANRRAEPPPSENATPPDREQPAVVLGPSLETEPVAIETESVEDRRIPARTMAGRPRVEILPEPQENSAARTPPGPDIEARLAGIQKNLDRLESALAVQAQRTPPVDVVQQTAEILKLLREAREFENAPAPSPALAAPDEGDKHAKTASNANDVQPEKTDYDADPDLTGQPAPAPPQTETRIYHPRYLSGSALQALVAPLLTREIGKAGATDAGTDESALAAGGDSSPAPLSVLVVRDLPDVLHKIDRLVKEVDVPPLSVKIEATVMTLRLDEARPQGVDLLEFNATNRGFVVSPATGSADSATTPARAAEATQLTHGFGLKCGVLQGDPRAFINMLQSAASLRRANSWQISVLNRQSAQLALSDVASPNTGTTQIPTGTTLRVRPIVTPDGVVHLDVRRDNESDRAAGNRSAALTHQIALREGQTAVVGGFFSEQLASYTYNTSGFGSMPLFGKRFRKQVDMLDRSETIVLLTPHVTQPIADLPGEARRGASPKVLPRGRPILRETAATSRFFGRTTGTPAAPAPNALPERSELSKAEPAQAARPQLLRRVPELPRAARVAPAERTTPPAFASATPAAQVPPRRLPLEATTARPIARNSDSALASDPPQPERSAESTPIGVLSPVGATAPVRPFRVEDLPAAGEADAGHDAVPHRLDTIPELSLPTAPQIVPNR
jgi:type II secretory pathway component GspD/PulD (secretin)